MEPGNLAQLWMHFAGKRNQHRVHCRHVGNIANKPRDDGRDDQHAHRQQQYIVRGDREQVAAEQADYSGINQRRDHNEQTDDEENGAPLDAAESLLDIFLL